MYSFRSSSLNFLMHASPSSNIFPLLCRLSDLVGADIGLHVGANFHDSFPERVYKAPIFPALFDAKRLGEKTGSGFYKFDSKRKTLPDAKGLAPFLEASRKVAPLTLGM